MLKQGNNMTHRNLFPNEQKRKTKNIVETIVLCDFIKNIELHYSHATQGSMKIYIDNKKFQSILFEEIEKHNMAHTNSTVIAQNIRVISNRALFNMSFNAIERKHKPEEVIANKEGLKLRKHCDLQSKDHCKQNRFSNQLSNIKCIHQHTIISENNEMDTEFGELMQEDDSILRENTCAK